MAAIENAEHIRLNYGSEVLRTHVLDSCEDSNSGVVNQNIDAAKRLHGMVKERSDFIVVSNVAHGACGLRFTELIQTRYGFMQFIFMTTTNRNIYAGSHQCFGDRSTDPTGSAGHHC